MKGYKGTDKDMKCRGFPFEIGKKYTIEGKIEICKRGFHFCENLYDVFGYYERNNENRFFEVEAEEPCETNGNKTVTAAIKLVRELTLIEVNRTIYGNGYGNGNGGGYGNGNGIQKVLKFIGGKINENMRSL